MPPVSAFAYKTRPGASVDPAQDPAAKVLIDHAEEAGAGQPKGRLLIIEAGCGALMARFAPGFAEAVCQNSRFPDHAASLATAAQSGFPPTVCLLGDLPRIQGKEGEGWLDSPCFPPGHFDQVVFRLGRGTALVNAALLQAFALLRRGGTFVACGHNREGIKSFAKRAEAVFGNAELLAIKSSCRCLRYRKESDAPAATLEDPRYFDPVKLLLPLRAGQGSEAHGEAAPAAIEYFSKPGIFSYRETDPATALLARHLPPCGGKTVLDLGCGSGALSLAAYRLGAAHVTAADVSAVAAACAERNFREHGYAGRAVCTFLTEGLEGQYDLVLSNPPFHQGAETDYSLPGRILDAILLNLKPEAEVRVVANQFLDYAGEGRKRFAHCEILAREKGYQVHRFEV